MSESLCGKIVLGLAGLLLCGVNIDAQRMNTTRRPVNPARRPPDTIPAPPVQPPRATPSLTIGTPAPPNLGGYPIQANPFIAPGVTLGQAAYNTGVLANSTAGAFGFNPFLSTLATGPALSPFSLATTSNPYLGGAPTLATSPYGGGYSMSTAPSGSYGSGGYGSSYGSGGYQDPLGAALQGYASLTRATGQYWKDIGQARLTREQANQAGLTTARKRIEFERWYESQKLTAPQMRDRELATELNRARGNPPPTEIWSGKALNDLLRNIQAGKLNRVRSPNLEEETLKHINLSVSSSRGNAGMLKDRGKLTWPPSLQEPLFDKPRTRLASNLRLVVNQLKDNDPVESALVKDINSDFKSLLATLNDKADTLSPAQYIESKRYLNQLSEAIRALSDPKVVNYFNNTWSAKGKNVAELVAHMSKEGLTFASAAPGEESAYNALYLALRNYEAGLHSAQR